MTLSNVTSPLLLKLPMMNDFSGLLDQDSGDHSPGNQLTPPRQKEEGAEIAELWKKQGQERKANEKACHVRIWNKTRSD